MIRREFLFTLFPMASVLKGPLILPVHQVLDARARLKPEQISDFSSGIWREAVRDFGRCGVQLRSDRVVADVRRSPSEKPIFSGLRHGAINLVLTNYVPLEWDNGRGLTGVATRYEGHDLCVIALNHAHGHQVPFLSVNTCVHELLHVLLRDVMETRPKGVRGEARELRIDLLATRLWLFHDGATIRNAVNAYLGCVPSPAC